MLQVGPDTSHALVDQRQTVFSQSLQELGPTPSRWMIVAMNFPPCDCHRKTSTKPKAACLEGAMNLSPIVIARAGSSGACVMLAMDFSPAIVIARSEATWRSI